MGLEDAKSTILDINQYITDSGKTLNSLKRQLRQRTALFSIFLSRMGGTTFEYDIDEDTTYLTSLDDDGKIKEDIIPNFRRWMHSMIADGDELLVRMRDFLVSDGASAPGEMYGTFESQAKFLTEEYRWYRVDYQVIRDDIDNHISAMIGYVQDIENEVMNRKNLEDKVMRDSMTKLYNREATEELINRRIANLQDREKAVIFLLDVDDFKAVNDNLGHLAGDNYIKAVSKALRKAFRDGDIIGRVGGDEFVVFISGYITIDVIEKQGQRMIDLLMRVPCKDDWKVTCSIGIAVTSDTNMSYNKMVARADEALYRSKSRGKNRFQLYGDNNY